MRLKDDHYSFVKHTDFFESLCVVSKGHKQQKYEIKKWGHRPFTQDIVNALHIPSTAMRNVHTAPVA